MTWKAASTAETGPLTWTSMPSREPPVTVRPLSSAKSDDGVVVGLRGAEARGELGGSEEVAVAGAGGIVECRRGRF